jgi:NADH:ubiquinone oxidoreductase subunit
MIMRRAIGPPFFVASPGAKARFFARTHQGHWTFALVSAISEQTNSEALMYFLKRLLTWWNSQTIGTQVWTARNGQKVGEDEQGNVYYQTKDAKRRWVIYNGESEASRVAPDWHGWLHFTWDQPPTKAPLKHKAWEKPHLENLTGSAAAYAPAGSLRAAVPVRRQDYEAWQPE